MRLKIYIILVILSSLMGYLEWGQNNASFLFDAEAVLLQKLFTDPQSVLHPFTLLPFAGQLLLLISLFLKKPNKKLIYSGIICLAVLLIFMLFVGLLAMNFKIIISIIPFIYFSLAVHRQIKRNS